MPQTLTLDDVAAYGAAPSPAAAAPPAKTLTLSQLADYGAPVDLRPRNVGPSQPQSAWKQFVSGATEEQPDDSSHGFLRSFYDTSLRPIVGMVHDSYVRGDLGEHAASEILDSFKDQLGNFAAHPDIRNLPIIGTGATATAARMQKQYDAGNYTGMIGSAAGFLGQFAAPNLIKTPPGVADLPKPIVDAATTAAAKVRAALPDSVPTIPASVTDAVVVAPPLAFKMRMVNRFANVANKLLGPSEADAAAGSSAPLSGADLARQKAILETRALDKTALVERMRQSLADSDGIEKPPAGTPAPTPAAPRPAAPTPDQYQASEADFQKSWDPGLPGTPSPLARWEPLDASPDARASLPAELQTKVEELRRETHTPEQLAAAQRLEDQIDEHAAFLRGRAQDLEWGNRARKADAIAASLFRSGVLEPTDAQLAKTSKELQFKDVPSPDDADMIRDRLAHAQTLQQAAEAARFPDAAAVRRALDAGETVPAAVLNDYPGLMAKAKTAQVGQ